MDSPGASPEPAAPSRSFAWFGRRRGGRGGEKGSPLGTSERQMQQIDPVVDLQVGKTMWESVPRNMRTELWLSLLAQNGRGPALGSLYVKLHKAAVPLDVKEAIFKDVSRSFPTHEFFRDKYNQKALYHLLRAYAAYDPEIGYCQGMNFVAATLLLYLWPRESDAFAAMVVLMQERGLRGHYTHDMRMLQVRLWQMGQLMPGRLLAHLEAHGVLTALYASSWFLTLFASEFPLSFVGRLLDVLLSASDDSVLMKVALRIMSELEAELLRLNDMESIITLIKTVPPKWRQEKLRCVLSDALCHTWDGEEAAMYACSKEAETVREAVDRTHRMKAEAPDAYTNGKTLEEESPGDRYSVASSASKATPPKAGDINRNPEAAGAREMGNSHIPRLDPPPSSSKSSSPSPMAGVRKTEVPNDDSGGVWKVLSSLQDPTETRYAESESATEKGIAAALATPLTGELASFGLHASLHESREQSYGSFIGSDNSESNPAECTQPARLDSFGSFKAAPSSSIPPSPSSSTNEASLTAAILESLETDIRRPAARPSARPLSMKELAARDGSRGVSSAGENACSGRSSAVHVAAMLRLNKGSSNGTGSHSAGGGDGGTSPAASSSDSSVDAARIWDERELDERLTGGQNKLLEAEMSALREMQLAAVSRQSSGLSAESSVDAAPVWDEAQLSAIKKINFWDSLGQSCDISGEVDNEESVIGKKSSRTEIVNGFEEEDAESPTRQLFL